MRRLIKDTAQYLTIRVWKTQSHRHQPLSSRGKRSPRFAASTARYPSSTQPISSARSPSISQTTTRATSSSAPYTSGSTLPEAALSCGCRSAISTSSDPRCPPRLATSRGCILPRTLPGRSTTSTVSYTATFLPMKKLIGVRFCSLDRNAVVRGLLVRRCSHGLPSDPGRRGEDSSLLQRARGQRRLYPLRAPSETRHAVPGRRSPDRNGSFRPIATVASV